MKLVVQRVTHASVEVNNEVVGEIGNGLMVLVVFGVSVETIMEGEVRKSGIVGKGVKVKILDWTRMDIASRRPEI